MNFVTCKLIGPSEIGGIHYFGLANQMFQIATALSYAKEHDLQCLLPMLNDRRFGSYKNNIFRKLNFDEFNEDEIEVEFTENEFSYSEITKANKIRLSGYFQSEKYFIKNRKLILDTFVPTEEIIKKIKNKYGYLLTDSASVHLRFGDYLKIQDHHPIIAKTDYYSKALDLTTKKNILVFSDDIKKAKKMREFKKRNVTFIEDNDEVTDLFLMSMCEDNIIANSSFSWWGAWLNTNPTKNVYAPSSWFGPAKSGYNTKDLIPESWQRIDCFSKKYNFKFF